MDKILYFDIETVPSCKLTDLPQSLLEYWVTKFEYDEKKSSYKSIEDYYKSNAPLFSEFSKVIAISCGYVNQKDNNIKIMNIYGDDEESILKSFIHIANKMGMVLCGHNIKQYSVPFLSKRCFVHSLEKGNIFNQNNVKPWDSKLIDIMNIYGSGMFGMTKFSNICYTLGVKGFDEILEYNKIGSIYYDNSSPETIKTISDNLSNKLKKVIEVYSKITYNYNKKMFENILIEDNPLYLD